MTCSRSVAYVIMELLSEACMHVYLHYFVTCLLCRQRGANLLIALAAEMVYQGDLRG